MLVGEEVGFPKTALLNLSENQGRGGAKVVAHY